MEAFLRDFSSMLSELNDAVDGLSEAPSTPRARGRDFLGSVRLSAHDGTEVPNPSIINGGDDSDGEVEVIPRVAPSSLAQIIESIQTDSAGGQNPGDHPHFPGVTEKTERTERTKRGEKLRRGTRGEEEDPLDFLNQLRNVALNGNILRNTAKMRMEDLGQMGEMALSAASATPLILASYNGSVNMVRVLLDKGAAVDGRSEQGFTALFLASQLGHLEICRILIEYGADVNAKSSTRNRVTPLSLACGQGLAEVVKILVDAGADLEHGVLDGSTAVFLCVSIGCREKEKLPAHLACARFLLQSGSNPNTRDTNSLTPILWASIQNCMPMVELLLEYKADPNYKANMTGSDTLTPLMVSVSRGYLELVRLLLKHGANPAMPNERLWTPLHVAMQTDDESCMVEITELLLGTKAIDIDACQGNGATPLYLAVQQRRADVVDILLCAGATPDICTNNDMSPLERAVAHADYEIVSLLLRHGANVKRVDKQGRTIMHVAAMVKDASIVSIAALLIERGAEVDRVSTQKGNELRPLQVALVGGNEEIAMLLLEHGAAP